MILKKARKNVVKYAYSLHISVIKKRTDVLAVTSVRFMKIVRLFEVKRTFVFWGGIHTVFKSNFSRLDMILFIFFCAHSVSWMMCGMSESPMSVSRYSTLGGTTGYAFLEISPSASSVRSVPDNTRDETSGISLHSSLNRITSCSWMMSRTRKAHLFPNRAMTLRMGQNSMMEFFSSFFCIFGC